MMAWITALYDKPTAKLKINGTLSGEVKISNVTRQGCPLPPLLFILSLEPFIRLVNRDASVSGFNIAGKE